MKRRGLFDGCLSGILGIAGLGAVVSWTSLTIVLAADPQAPASRAAEPKAKKTAPEIRAKKLGGAELYAVHCNRCHPERYAMEWTPGQWKTIITHMRVRANLPAAHAREILQFLEANSGR